MIFGQTITYRVYKDAKNYLGMSTVDMPEISFMTETISGSGIAGEMEVPAIGMTGPLSATVNWISQCPGFFDLMDTSTSANLEFRASLQLEDETTGLRSTRSLRIAMLTKPKTISLGSLETAKQQGGSSEYELSRLLVEYNGKEVLLIDKLAFIYRVNGKDMLAKVRADIGMEF